MGQIIEWTFNWVKIRSCLFGVCLILTTTTFSQPEVDSLKLLLKQSLPDTIRVIHLNRLSELHIYSNPQYSLELANEALQLSIKANTLRGKAISENRIGSAYWSLGDLSNGLKHYTAALAISEEINDSSLTAYTIGRIALIYSSSGVYTISIEYEKRALAHFIKLSNKERMMVLYNNIGKDFLELESLDSAQFYTEKAYALVDANTSFAAIIPLKLADIALRKKNYSDCQKYLEEVYRIANKDKDFRSLSRYHQIYAELDAARNELIKAQKHSERSVAIADSTHILELQFEAYKTHAKILNLNSEYKKGFQFLNSYIKFRDSLKSVQQQNLLTLREFDLRERDLNKLKHEEEIALEQSKDRLVIIIGLGVLLTISVLVILNINRLRENKQKLNLALQEKNKELEIRNSQFERISNFRDKVLSILSHDIRGPISSARTLLDLHHKGRISSNEMVSFLDELSVKLDVLTSLTSTLLAWARTKFEDPLIKQVEFNIKELVDKICTALDHQINIKQLTIINEINNNSLMKSDIDIIESVMRNVITNAIKYSNAGGRIWINYERTNSSSKIKVTDEGVGFPAELKSKLFSTQVTSSQGTSGESGVGIGLLLCRDLLVEINGKIWASNNTDKGTTFFIEVQNA